MTENSTQPTRTVNRRKADIRIEKKVVAVPVDAADERAAADEWELASHAAPTFATTEAAIRWARDNLDDGVYRIVDVKREFKIVSKVETTKSLI